MRKFCVLVLCFLLLCVPPAKAVTARGAVTLEQSSRRVLFEQDAHTLLPPASTTKIMTALLAVESGRLGETVTVSAHAAATGGSSMYLTAGERLTLADAVRGLLIVSGNDAAVVIAETLAGSEEAFAEKMNERARECGAYDTHFVNPHGLPDPEHVTTAYDLARIACAALDEPFIAETVATVYAEVHDESGTVTHYLHSKNRILTGYDGGCGVKTGYTAAAGRCLISAAKRGGMTAVTVVLNAPDMFADSMLLLDRAFSDYAMETVAGAGETACTVPVSGGRARTVGAVYARGAALPIKIDGTENFIIQYDVPEALDAPIRQGERIGSAAVSIGNETFLFPLMAETDVEADTFADNVRLIIRDFLGRKA